MTCRPHKFQVFPGRQDRKTNLWVCCLGEVTNSLTTATILLLDLKTFSNTIQCLVYFYCIRCYFILYAHVRNNESVLAVVSFLLDKIDII